MIENLFGKIKIHFKIFIVPIYWEIYFSPFLWLMYFYYIKETDSTMLRKWSVIFQSFLLLGLLLQVSSQWTRWGSWSSCTNLRQSRERTLTKRQTRRCRGNIKSNVKPFSLDRFWTDGSNPIPFSFINLFLTASTQTCEPNPCPKDCNCVEFLGSYFCIGKDNPLDLCARN